MDCGMGSDLDIAVSADVPQERFADEIYKLFTELPSETDILDLEHINNSLLKKNIEKGVVIYVSECK